MTHPWRWGQKFIAMPPEISEEKKVKQNFNIINEDANVSTIFICDLFI